MQEAREAIRYTQSMKTTLPALCRLLVLMSAAAGLCVPASRAQELLPSMQGAIQQAKQAGAAMTSRPKEDGAMKELAARILQNQANVRMWGDDVEVETSRVKTADGKLYSLAVLADQSLKNVRSIVAYEWSVSDIEDGKKAAYRAVVVDLSGRPREVRSGASSRAERTVETPGAGEAASFAADFKLFQEKLKVKDTAEVFAALPARGIPVNIGDPDGSRMLVFWKHGKTSERWQVTYEGRVGQPGADFVFFKRLHTDDDDGFVRKNDVTLYRTDFKGGLKSMSRGVSESNPADRVRPTRPAASDAAAFKDIVGKVFPAGS